MKFRRKSLSTQLFKMIFGFFLLITATITIIQMVVDYQQTDKLVENQISELNTTFGPAIANALWTFDVSQLQSVLTGMDRISVVEGVVINDGKTISGIGKVILKNGAYAKFNDEGAALPIGEKSLFLKLSKHEFPVVYKESNIDEETLGSLTIYSSSEVVFDRVKNGFLLIVMGAILKTIALWIIFRYFVNKILEKPLQALTNQTKHISFDKIHDAQVSIEKYGENELSELENAFNKMVNNLSITKKIQDEFQDNLEKMVEERTYDLQHEIEQRVNAQDQAEKALQAKSMFLANMSHEIRTPMTAVLGMAKILDSLTKLDEKQKQYVDIILRNGENLLVIINDILDFSKFEAGTLQLEISKIEIQTFLNNIIESFSSQVSNKEILLEVEIDKNMPAAIFSDITRLTQILTNLVSNAIKFTVVGSVKISVQRERDVSGDIIHFSIKDTGVGIPKQAQEQVFDAFTQADASTTRKFGGTGLGLAICEKLTHILGGRIWLESEEFKGTTFHFTASSVNLNKSD